MPGFTKGPNWRTPFGRNPYLGSTANTQFDHGTVAAATVPAETIDDATDQKILQSGTVLAKITSGANSGKLGPFDLSASDGRQTAANIVGVCDTYLPWQLMEGDREVAYLYHGTVVQAACFIYNAQGAKVALTDAVAADMFGKKKLDITFRTAANSTGNVH